MNWIKKDDLTLKEYNSLSPTYGIFKGVNFDEVKYYKDNRRGIYELSYCSDGSLTKRISALEDLQKRRKLMKSFGL